MIELKRRDRGNQIAYIFKRVPELGNRDINGYVEIWHTGNDRDTGIKINPDQLVYAECVSKGQGCPLGNKSFFGMTAQDRFYDEMSYLINGSILTFCSRKTYFGKSESTLPDLPRIRVSNKMPGKVVTIIGETEGKVLETAELLKLPLEELV